MKIKSGMRMRKKNKSVQQFKFLIVMLLVGGISWVAMNEFNNSVIPIATTISSMEAKNRVSKIIYEVIDETISKNKITSPDFYSKTEDVNGIINSLSVNTVLVNELCSKVSYAMTSKLTNSKNIMIEIPFGTLIGLDFLANIGPNYSVDLLPVGNAAVDYETKFEAVGINQVNFQVWLIVTVNMRIVNPMQKNDVTITRKVSLVNTVFSGRVPDAYYPFPVIK